MFTIVHSLSLCLLNRQRVEKKKKKKERDNLRVNFVDAIKTIGWRWTSLHEYARVTTIEFVLDGKEKINYDDDWINKRKLWLDNNRERERERERGRTRHLQHLNERIRRKTHTLTWDDDDVVECQRNKTYIVLNQISLPSSLTGCSYQRA